MCEDREREDFEIFTEDYESGGLIPEEEFREDGEVFEYDEDGTLALARSLRPVSKLLTRPCSLRTLNGSWYVQLVPVRNSGFYPYRPIRGPMRIEVGRGYLRISGDIYVQRLGSEAPRKILEPPSVPPGLVISKRWYPHLPFKEYSAYFRSVGVRYNNGKLTFKFVRHKWHEATEEFVGSDGGWMELLCSGSWFTPRPFPWWPWPAPVMKGRAVLGGVTYDVTATKTSPYYRGCHVEVEVMKNRSWPASATSCDGNQTFTFTGVYRAAGLDFRAVVSDVDIPEDLLLTTAELHNLLSTHRDIPHIGHSWRVWLLVGSRVDGTLGLMFDSQPPHREGAAGFYDPTLPAYSTIEPSAQGRPLGEVPLAFLRTLIHESGHVFNLYHPKHEGAQHSVPIGTTIMNQTGDVMGFSSAANPYPCSATMAFNNHNRTSLIHSPDPQVAPGWKEFGWGHSHGSAHSLAEPADVLEAPADAPTAEGLRFEVDLPAVATHGEFVVAKLTVTNDGDVPRQVTTALNLSEGDLRMWVKDPGGNTDEIRDVVLACSDRRTTELEPTKSLTGQVQLFFTNRGHTFKQIGRYEVEAELDIGDAEGSVIRTAPIDTIIEPATTKEGRELELLTMDVDVGQSLALGDFGADEAAGKKLTEAAERFGDTTTGAACALVVANSLARDFRNVRKKKVLRPANKTEAERVLDIALKNRDATSVAGLACAVVSPRETTAPVLDEVRKRFKVAKKDAYKKADLEQADKLFADHLA